MLCPLMLEPFWFITGPSAHWPHEFAQVIDVPMLGFVHAPVTGYARSHTTWSEGAANVDVVSRHEFDWTEMPYL